MALATMDRVRLGRSDLAVSPLGIGTWAWGDRLVWGYGREYGAAELEEAYRVAVSAGITFFDTAELYGRGAAERFLGRFRQDDTRPVVIGTKFFPYPWRWRTRDLIRALKGSLTRLRLTQVALYQIHWPFPPWLLGTWVAGMVKAVQDGMAHAPGVSNFSAPQVRQAHAALARVGLPLASNQVPYSLLDRRIERNGVLAACQELRVSVIAYSPLAMGILSGKYTPEQPPPGWRGYRYSRAFLTRLLPLLGELREIGAAHGGKTPAQVALNWVLGKGAIPIVGVKRADQVTANCGALGWQLSAEEMATLDSLSAPVARW